MFPVDISKLCYFFFFHQSPVQHLSDEASCSKMHPVQELDFKQTNTKNYKVFEDNLFYFQGEDNIYICLLNNIYCIFLVYMK